MLQVRCARVGSLIANLNLPASEGESLRLRTKQPPGPQGPTGDAVIVRIIDAFGDDLGEPSASVRSCTEVGKSHWLSLATDAWQPAPPNLNPRSVGPRSTPSPNTVAALQVESPLTCQMRLASSRLIYKCILQESAKHPSRPG